MFSWIKFFFTIKIYFQSGQQVIDIYLALQDIKTILANKEEDTERTRLYYKILLSNFYFYVNTVAEQLPASSNLIL